MVVKPKLTLSGKRSPIIPFADEIVDLTSTQTAEGEDCNTRVAKHQDDKDSK